jgi:hypothetical protein
MTVKRRIIVGVAIVGLGLVAQAGLEAACGIDRPSLRRPLASLPTTMGDWVGAEHPVTEQLVAQAQATEYLSRVYESRRYPGLQVRLWVNYSILGDNLRHSPKICLPSGGWTENEAQRRILEVATAGGPTLALTRLGYTQGDLVSHIGFWYYIFGEGRIQNYIRRLPITSQSSYGRATRGSSITIEIFYPGDRDPNGDGLRDFAGELVRNLDPILPEGRAAYFLP